MVPRDPSYATVDYWQVRGILDSPANLPAQLSGRQRGAGPAYRR